MVSDNSAGAIFASHSLATIAAIRALREAGLSDSVALVGFDHFELADLVEPGVTVIAPLLEASTRRRTGSTSS